jgi:hypothetical protein
MLFSQVVCCWLVWGNCNSCLSPWISIPACYGWRLTPWPGRFACFVCSRACTVFIMLLARSHDLILVWTHGCDAPLMALYSYTACIWCIGQWMLLVVSMWRDSCATLLYVYCQPGHINALVCLEHNSWILITAIFLACWHPKKVLNG